jgi:tRNA pseudouridine55 synthase
MARDGLLVIDKPAGPTSHDVVQRVRRALGTRRVGHGGTLDPAATGVLLIAAGQATRFFPFLSKETKSYDGRIRLGFATDTYDASGRPAAEESRDLPDLDRLAAAMKSFEGPILQTPPRFSAKKLNGKPVYRLARADVEFTLEPAAVTIGRFNLRAYQPPFIDFEAECSAGTYIRSLAHDLGQRLGCGGHLDTLRRTSVGPYALSAAVPLLALEETAARGEEDRYVIPLERLLPGTAAVTVIPGAEQRVRNGSLIGPADLETAPPGQTEVPWGAPLIRLFSASGRLLALARPSPDGDRIHPFLVLSP